MRDPLDAGDFRIVDTAVVKLYQLSLLIHFYSEKVFTFRVWNGVYRYEFVFLDRTPGEVQILEKQPHLSNTDAIERTA